MNFRTWLGNSITCWGSRLSLVGFWETERYREEKTRDTIQFFRDRPSAIHFF